MFLVLPGTFRICCLKCERCWAQPTNVSKTDKNLLNAMTHTSLSNVSVCLEAEPMKIHAAETPAQINQINSISENLLFVRHCCVDFVNGQDTQKETVGSNKEQIRQDQIH